ncbi:MAG: sensor histidine kinase [Clostridia bacterium]
MQSTEKQKQFITDAGHEIKTPLAIILANTDAMELHSGVSKWSQNIRAQTVRLNGLMQNLLALAKLDEGNVHLDAEAIVLSQLLEESLHSFEEAAELKGISIQKEIQPDVTIHGNRDSIARLLSILMDNAVQYSPPEGRITISLQLAEKQAVLRIKNACENRPAEDPGKLFDRFYRGDSARTRNQAVTESAFQRQGRSRSFTRGRLQPNMKAETGSFYRKTTQYVSHLQTQGCRIIEFLYLNIKIL